MRMMNFILPLLKLSNRVRDALIEVLRKAMNKYSLHYVFIYSFYIYVFRFLISETIEHVAWPSLVIV